MDQSGLTIREVLESVNKNLYVLPPIQQEFVYDPEQICRLFDRLMQGQPIGPLMFWSVAPEQSGHFKFYGFVKDYHQRDAPQCPELGVLPDREVAAVIDGQQRLTALNIGLQGSMAIKESGKWRPDAFPRKLLYLDLFARKGEGKQYRFQFKDAKKAQADRAALWYPVHNIMAIANPPAFMQWLAIAFHERRLSSDAEQFMRAGTTLHRLHELVHIAPTITFYSEKSQELDRVVRLFMRIKDACSLTVKLVASFGGNEPTLHAEGGLLPIAYYLLKRNPPESWLSTPASKAERDQIRSWLTRS